jgi:hypothetical protein
MPQAACSGVFLPDRIPVGAARRDGCLVGGAGGVAAAAGYVDVEAAVVLYQACDDGGGVAD